MTSRFLFIDARALPFAHVVNEPVVWMNVGTHKYQACINTHGRRTPVDNEHWSTTPKKALRDNGITNVGKYYLHITNKHLSQIEIPLQLAEGYSYYRGRPFSEEDVDARWQKHLEKIAVGIYMEVLMAHEN